MLRVGTSDAVHYAKAKAGEATIPSLHSPLYYPIPEPTIKTGVLTLTTGVLNLLEKK
jgi:hippurate hydrolase